MSLATDMYVLIQREYTFCGRTVALNKTSLNSTHVQYAWTIHIHIDNTQPAKTEQIICGHAHVKQAYAHDMYNLYIIIIIIISIWNLGL